MANGWGGYNEAFANLGNFAANLILQNAERKRKEAEEEKRKADTERLLGRLISGGETTLTPRTEYRPAITEPQPPTKFGDLFAPKQGLSTFGKESPFREVAVPVQTFEPYTPEQKVNLAMQLRNVSGGAQTLDDYLQLQRFYNPPQKQPKNVTTQNDKYLVFENPETGMPIETKIENRQWKPNVVELNPNVPIFDEQTGKYVAYRGYPDDEGDVEILGQRYKTVSKYEKTPKSNLLDRVPLKETGKLYEREGYYNPAANLDDPDTAVINGKRYTITGRKSLGEIEAETDEEDGYGNIVKRMSKMGKGTATELFGKFKGAITRIQGATRQNKAVNVDLIKEREDARAEYAAFVESHFSEDAWDVHKKLFTIDSKTGKADVPDPKDYWSGIINAWKQKTIEPNDFEWLSHRFMSIYGFNPLAAYGAKEAK